MAPPWANLTAKFQDVIDAINALKTEQQATNAKLDLLIAKDYTIAGDVIANLTGVETRLDAIKLALVGASPDTTDIRAAIWGLAGPAPGKTLADIHAALIGTDLDPTDIRQAIWNLAGPAPGTTLTQLWAKIDAIHGALGFSGLGNPSLRQLLEWQLGTYATGMQLYNIIDQIGINAAFLDTINTAIGGVPNNSLELTSVRGLLNAMMQCACAKNDGPPLIGDDAVCASPYVSDGMHLFPWEFSPLGGTSVMIADFPDPPPSGLEFSGVAGNRSELNADDWSDWRVWVASEAAQFAMDYGLDRYPTNEWVELSGSGTKAFSVDARYGLSVTLCYQSSCITLQSELLHSNFYGYNYHTIVFNDINLPEFTKQNYMALNQSDVYEKYVSLWGTFDGWRMVVSSGGGGQFLLNGVTRATNGDLSGTGGVSVNYSGDAGNQQAFTVDFCKIN